MILIVYFSNINKSKKKYLIINTSIISPDYLSKRNPSVFLINKKNTNEKKYNSTTNKNKAYNKNKDIINS